MVRLIISLPSISCSVKPSNGEMTFKRRLPLFCLGPMAPFFMHACFLCLECLLSAWLESPPPHSQICQSMGLNVGPTGKRVGIWLSWPCYTRLSGKAKDFRRMKRFIKLPKGWLKSCKRSQNRDGIPKGWGGEDLISGKVVHVDCLVPISETKLYL